MDINSPPEVLLSPIPVGSKNDKGTADCVKTNSRRKGEKLGRRRINGVIAKWNNGHIQGEDRNKITILREVMDDYMDDYIVTDNPARVIEAFVNTLVYEETRGPHKAEPEEYR